LSPKARRKEKKKKGKGELGGREKKKKKKSLDACSAGPRCDFDLYAAGGDERETEKKRKERRGKPAGGKSGASLFVSCSASRRKKKGKDRKGETRDLLPLFADQEEGKKEKARRKRGKNVLPSLPFSLAMRS